MYVERIRIPNPTYPSAASLEQRERSAYTERAVMLDGDRKRENREHGGDNEQLKREEPEANPPDETLKEQPAVDVVA